MDQIFLKVLDQFKLQVMDEGDKDRKMIAVKKFFLSYCPLMIIVSCSSTPDPSEQIIRGSISYPFYSESHLVGRSQRQDPFVIRTVKGDTEYIVEIPYAAEDYDIEIPLGEILPADKKNQHFKNAQVTDRELVSSMPKLSAATEEEKALLDKAFGVASNGGPRQAPSYTIGLNRVIENYKKNHYELSLVEINNLLSFYPTSVRLHKMKGTILIKLGNFKLAERSWLRASELNPNDPVILRGINKLRERMKFRRELAFKAARNGPLNSQREEAQSTSRAVDPKDLPTLPASRR